jgi:hypothetical protein
MNDTSKDNTWFNKALKRAGKMLIAQQKRLARLMHSKDIKHTEKQPSNGKPMRIDRYDDAREFLFKIELMEKCKHIYFNH